MKKEHQPASKKYVERKFHQSFSVVDFRQMSNSGFFKTYDEVKVLHDPMQASQAAPAVKPLDKLTRVELAVLYKEKFGIEPTDAATKAVILKELEGTVPPPVNDDSDATLAALRKQYIVKYGEEAPAEATIEDLAELLK